MSWSRFTLLLLLALVSPTQSRAQTITYVSSVAALQTAFNSVTAGGIVEIASGSYAVPSTLSISGPRRFTIRAATGANVILSGSGVRRIMTVSNGAGPLTLERLTFANGVDDVLSPPVGGVLVSNSQATFVNCVFQNNGSANSGGAGGVYVAGSTVFFQNTIWTGNASKNFGAGMVIDQATVYVHNSQFLNNRTNFPGHTTAALGGAIHMDGGVLRVTNTRFEGNEAGWAGGALYAIGLFGDRTSDVVVSNSSFIGNRSIKAPGSPAGIPVGGAVHVEDDTTAKFYNCRFVGNESRQGGGISSYRAVVEVSGSVFQANEATTLNTGEAEGLGGAIIALSDETGPLPNRRPMKLTVTDTLFQGRFGAVTTTARQGGCLFLAGDANRNWGLYGLTQDGNSASNRATVDLTRVVFDDCDVAGDMTFPGAGGALFGVLLALTVTDSLVIDSDATGPEFYGVLPAGGGFMLQLDSISTITRTTFARNSAVLHGGAISASAGMLNLEQCNLIENTLTSPNASAGSAVITGPNRAGGGIPDIDMTGLIHASTLSNNSGNGFIEEDDTVGSGPANNMQYSSNTIFPTAIVYFNPDPSTGFQSVAQLNALTLHGQKKAPSANVAAASAPIAGAILAAPPARLPLGASGDATFPTSYVAYAWSGSTATLDGQARSGNAGLEEASPGAHTLSVSSTPFTTSIAGGALPATVLIANPSEVASGQPATLDWTTVAGTFLDEAIDQGVALSPSLSGGVSVSPTSTGTYRAFLVTAEGGAVSAAIVDIRNANDRIFRDGFESGNLSAWSLSSTDGGDLSASPEAVLTDGSFGMKALVDDTNSLDVEDQSPNGVSRYRARFYFDPNGFDPGEGSNHFRVRLLIAFDGAGKRVLTLVLRRSIGAYGLRGRVRLDNGAWADTSFVPMSNGPHPIELDWKRSSSPAANDGSFGLWIDGELVATLTGLDNNGSTLSSTRLGAIGVKAGAQGTMYFDEFESRRALYIGLHP